MKKSTFFLILIMLVSFSQHCFAQNNSVQKIVLIRHAEKADNGDNL